MITIIITGVIALIVGFVLGYLLINMTLKYRSKNIIKEAEAEAEVIKKDKILQAKEKFLQIKAEHEKQVNARNSKILLAENKLKQKDAELARKMEECQRKIKDAETQQETLEAQKELLEKKHAELDKFKKQQIEQLEAISGMSADQAKEKLISSLKDEAETEAMSYVNEIMEEAKMTANMEAKKIVVKPSNGWPRKPLPKMPYQYSILIRMKSRDVLSDGKDVTSGRWKQPPVLKSSWTTPRRQLYFPDLTR